MQASRITGGKTTPLFTTKVLGQYSVTYYQCDETGFIQTEQPYWLDEAYSDAITAIDLGLVERNLLKADLTDSVLQRSLQEASKFLDYGGGYGMFTRLMRDKGFDFLNYDIHCENLFSTNFHVPSLADYGDRFDLVTAWEVFEHVVDPRQTIEEIVSKSDAVLFSTELAPNISFQSSDDWWYFAPETGQHISFHTDRSLRYLADELGLYFYSDGVTNHMLSRFKLATKPFANRRRKRRWQRNLESLFAAKKRSRESLLPGDFNAALNRLRENLQKKAA